MIKLDKANLMKRWRMFASAMRLIWKATGRWTLGWGVLLLLQGALPAVVVYMAKVLVDRLAAVMGNGYSPAVLDALFGPLALLAGILLLGQLFQAGITWVRTAQAELLQDHIKGLVHEQAARVDLEFYESPAYYDEMERANSQADKDVLTLLENLGQMIQHGVTLVAIAALIMPYGVWLPLVLVVSTLPAFAVVLWHNIAHHKWWERTTEDRRRTQYYDWILTSRYYAPEVRVFNLSKHFRDKFNLVRSALRKTRLLLMRKQSVSQAGAGITAFLVTGSVMAWMVFRAINGLATLGDLALFYQAFQKGQSLTRTLLSNLGQVFSSMLFLEHLFKFLNIKPRMSSPAIVKDMPAPPYAIEVDNVDFRYPGSDQLALEGFSIKIPEQSTIAILGPNGAGKSTLIKMLCRFYDPENGAVKINGIDVKEISQEALLNEITVLFQYWVNYAGSLSETIAMGDLRKSLDMKRIKAASKASGVASMLAELPAGFDTMLDKRFSGGVDLSGGQWQRIALARAFYREASILLLDEPTSYMDPWAEARWLDSFFALAEHRTTVVVTHRLSTAMRADKIYVMDAGRIVESGTHGELLLLDGLYAQSWIDQVGVGGASFGKEKQHRATTLQTVKTNSF